MWVSAILLCDWAQGGVLQWEPRGNSDHIHYHSWCTGAAAWSWGPAPPGILPEHLSYIHRQVSTRQSCHLPTLSLTKGMKTCKYSSPTASSLERFCGVPHRSPELSCKTESCYAHLLWDFPGYLTLASLPSIPRLLPHPAPGFCQEHFLINLIHINPISGRASGGGNY